MMRGVQAPHFLSLCFNLSGDAVKKRENLARARGSFRPPPLYSGQLDEKFSTPRPL